MALRKVSDLTPGLCEDIFLVKIIRKFQGVYPHGTVREFILSDYTGNHIQATVLPSIKLDISLMNEGDSFELSRFICRIPPTAFWNTTALLHIYFGDFTSARRVESITESSCIRYSAFPWLTSWLHVGITDTVHIVGRIKNVYNVVHEEAVTTMGVIENVPVLSFLLCDRDRRLMECKAYGEYVHTFAGLKANLNRNGGTYCALRFWKLDHHNGNVTVVSSFDGVSDVVINPDIPEIEEIRAIF